MRIVRKIVLAAVLGWFTVTSLYPLVWLLMNSFKTNQEIFVTNTFGPPTVLHWGNYAKAWKEFNFLTYFSNSLIVSASVILGTLLLSLMFAYATSRMEWRLSAAARIYVSAGMFIPVQIMLLPLLILVRSLHMNNSLLTLIIPYIAFQLAFTSIIFHGFFRTIPMDMEEAAALDGAGVFRTFLRIILPMMTPVIATVAIMVFLYTWNEFTVALILITKPALKTLPLGLLAFQGQYQTDWGAMSASLVLSSVPTVIVYLLFSDKVERALSIGRVVK